MIDEFGWLSWAERVPGHVAKQNGGVNKIKGLFAHSAEGYEAYLRADPPRPTGVSWHLSNLFDGRLLQHYSLFVQCWHATAANNSYVGMEHEGRVPNEPTLTDAQVVTARRVIAEIAEWRHWTPSRPSGPLDTSHTLWEHREVVRLGGTATACPSGRIPWDKILAAPEDEMIRYNAEALPGFWHDLTIAGDQPMNARGDLGLPLDARIVRLDVWLTSGALDVWDGSGTAFAGAVGGDAPRRAAVDVILDANGYCLLRGQAVVRLLGCVGYFE